MSSRELLRLDQIKYEMGRPRAFIPKKDNIPNKVFKWLMKINVTQNIPVNMQPCKHSLSLSFVQPPF